MRATLTLMGMYRTRPDILDEFILPSEINRNVFMDNLLMVTGEMEVLYSNPDFLKDAIAAWSRMELANWEWLFSTQNYDYNPIWNVDVKESTRDDRKETRNLRGTNYETRNLSGTNNETRNLSGTNNETRNLSGSDTGTVKNDKTGTDTTINYVSAYNDVSGNTQSNKQTTTYGNSNLETRNLNSTDTGTDNFTTSDTGTDNFSTTDTGTDNYDSTDTGTIDHNDKLEFYKRGNQGTTTTQQMIREEQELAKINFDDYIIEQFKQRFCLLVY